jgi:hypothetical protein
MISKWPKDEDKPPKWGWLEERRAQRIFLIIIAIMSAACGIVAIYEFITNWFSITPLIQRFSSFYWE